MINLEAKEHFLAAVLEYCEDIVTVKDKDLNYIAYNKSFRKIIGVSDNFVITGKSVTDVLGSDTAEILINTSYKAISTNETQTCIFKLKSKNKIIKQTITPIFNNNKIEGLLAISSDVTTEESLKKKLINKNLLLNTLINNLPFLVYMKDNDRNIIAANDIAKHFLKEGIDTYANNIKINLDESEEVTKNEDNYVLENKKQLIKEKSAIDALGKLHWYKIHKSPILTENNDINGLLTIAENIDKEKCAENQKELFLATLSHDLKNPLLAQIYSLERLYKQFYSKINEEQREILELIIESSKYMRDMLCTLLKTCKESNGIINLHRTNFNIEQLLNRCIKEIKDMALTKNIDIDCLTTKINIPQICADEIQIRRVLSNILNNAVNYAFENSTLNIKLYSKNNSIFISVKNNSYEVPKKLKANIFDKYVCGDYSQSNNGVGLGLYFCKKIVEAHDGNIKLITNGTINEFIIELPLLKENSAFVTEVVL